MTVKSPLNSHAPTAPATLTRRELRHKPLSVPSINVQEGLNTDIAVIISIEGTIHTFMMSKSAAPNTNSSSGGARHEVPLARHDIQQQLGAPQPQPQPLLRTQ